MLKESEGIKFLCQPDLVECSLASAHSFTNWSQTRLDVILAKPPPSRLDVLTLEKAVKIGGLKDYYKSFYQTQLGRFFKVDSELARSLYTHSVKAIPCDLCFKKLFADFEQITFAKYSSGFNLSSLSSFALWFNDRHETASLKELRDLYSQLLNLRKQFEFSYKGYDSQYKKFLKRKRNNLGILRHIVNSRYSNDEASRHKYCVD